MRYVLTVEFEAEPLISGDVTHQQIATAICGVFGATITRDTHASVYERTDDWTPPIAPPSDLWFVAANAETPRPSREARAGA